MKNMIKDTLENIVKMDKERKEKKWRIQIKRVEKKREKNKK